MLTPEQIEAYRLVAERITDPITSYLLKDIARRISEAGKCTSTAAYQLWLVQQLGATQRKMERHLQALLKISEREVEKLLRSAAEFGYDLDLASLTAGRSGTKTDKPVNVQGDIRRTLSVVSGTPDLKDVPAVPFEKNHAVQQITEEAVEMGGKDLENVTQTLGFVNRDGVCRPLTEAFQKASQDAFFRVSTGAADYNTAVREATRELARQGIQTIDYESGVHTALDAAVRRNIMGGLGLMQEQISKQNHDDMEATGWEISAHFASAPDHEPIQGQQYSDADYTALNNSLVRRIGTLNCGHTAFPIILGVTPSQYTPAELEEMRQKNEVGVTYNGRRYTTYEATQTQRAKERAIRRQRRAVLVSEALGDEKRLQNDRIKLVTMEDEYTRFSKETGLRTQTERLEVGGYGPKQAVAAKKTVYEAQKGTIAVAGKPAIMKRNSVKREDTTVQTIGRIDTQKYSVVSQDIRTDEVVITDERVQHIKDRHPNDFERYSNYLKDIVENPQYILEDNSPNTAVILNEYIEDGERFRLILRLAVPKDPPGYKNSVITFMEISERKYQKYLRNKKILYRSE